MPCVNLHNQNEAVCIYHHINSSTVNLLIRVEISNTTKQKLFERVFSWFDDHTVYDTQFLHNRVIKTGQSNQYRLKK